MDREEIIRATLRDLVADFLYYDRKEDENLGVGEIEEAILNKEISWGEIVDLFEETLLKSIS